MHGRSRCSWSMSSYAIVCADEVLPHVMQRRGAAAQEFAHFMGQVVKLPDLPVGVALAGGLAVFEVSIADNARICEDGLSAPADPKGLQVYAWFVVGEIVGKRQLIGTHSPCVRSHTPTHDVLWPPCRGLCPRTEYPTRTGSGTRKGTLNSQSQTLRRT